jgi:hypothetical protein
MRLELTLTADEQMYLEYLATEVGTMGPHATVRRIITDMIDSEGPCLDPRRNRFEGWKAAQQPRGELAGQRCTKLAPCAGCRPYLALARLQDADARVSR